MKITRNNEAKIYFEENKGNDIDITEKHHFNFSFGYRIFFLLLFFTAVRIINQLQQYSSFGYQPCLFIQFCISRTNV